MLPDRTVFVVDDDAELRDSVCALVTSMGTQAKGFSSAETFLSEYRVAERGVVVVDLRMPGMNGLELQEELLRRKSHLPVIILTAYARTSTIVRAVQAGAVTAIDKPYYDDDLWDAIRSALKKEELDWAASQQHREIHSRVASLTPEQLRVGELIVAGHANKEIARKLGLALRTIEKRRHDVMVKMQVSSVAELVALFLELRDIE